MCSSDLAVKKVLEVVDWVSDYDGGNGAVREIIEYIYENKI